MPERTFKDQECRKPLKESDLPVYFEDEDSRRAFPLAAAALGAALFLLVMLIVNLAC